MLNEAVETREQEIAVKPRNIEVLLDDERKLPLILQLPPLAELEEIRKLAENKISVRALVTEGLPKWQEEFASELAQHLAKYPRFKDSVTFLNHLASLAELAGK